MDYAHTIAVDLPYDAAVTATRKALTRPTRCSPRDNAPAWPCRTETVMLYVAESRQVPSVDLS